MVEFYDLYRNQIENGFASSEDHQSFYNYVERKYPGKAIFKKLDNSNFFGKMPLERNDYLLEQAFKDLGIEFRIVDINWHFNIESFYIIPQKDLQYFRLANTEVETFSHINDIFRLVYYVRPTR